MARVTHRKAVPISEQILRKLPESKPEDFQKSDFIASLIVFFITLCLYMATLAPSVTMEDSGELITGAAAFGVPHSPGYPLWTLIGFIFSHVIPYGNMAWRVNLESAVFGAMANAIMTLLVSHSGRWLLQRWTLPEEQEGVRAYTFYAGILAGLTIGFSDVMWSQAVIAEVYTLNALFVMAVLFCFYRWILDPQKLDRLLITVFIFALGLTNHHTLIQIIPAFIVAGFLLRKGQAWSLLLSILLFSLSVLIYVSWLSQDIELQTISLLTGGGIILFTLFISIICLEKFKFSQFCLGGLVALAIFFYGHYILVPFAGTAEANDTALVYGWKNAPHFWLIGTTVNPGWLQFKGWDDHFLWLQLTLFFTTLLALGLLFSSRLNYRMVALFFMAGWVGLSPYYYEQFASSTNPPMNWGYPSKLSGFYYAVSRFQYTNNLPNLIKNTVGKALGVVPYEENNDAALGQPNYAHRLGLTLKYYGEDLIDNFSAPLIFIPLALLLFIGRVDSAQRCWLIFLGVAFFTLGFMLHLISPPLSFDHESILQYKVFNLQSHCIFIILFGYGALAGMLFLNKILPVEFVAKGPFAVGYPSLYLSLLPLISNFDDCNQADHWFGYQYGYDIMAPLDPNAIYIGGSDAGRFVPTYMAFIESQQPNSAKTDPQFDRRDVTVLTQAALCDPFYMLYIQHHYDADYRPKPEELTPFERWLGRDRAYPKIPIKLYSEKERSDLWNKFNAENPLSENHPIYTANDVFKVNGMIAKLIFDRNKETHTFYIEQSIPMDWMYPYLLPCGPILKLNKEPMDKIPPKMVEEDRRFWDAYSKKLLNDPKFYVDDDARHYFSKLADWHADLYHFRGMDKEEEYWRKMALQLCPWMGDTIYNLIHLYYGQSRFDEVDAVMREAIANDPRNESFQQYADQLNTFKKFRDEEKFLRDKLAKSPYDVEDTLALAQILESENKIKELNDTLTLAAGLTNWTKDTITPLVSYYEKAHRQDAVLAFLQARLKIEPHSADILYRIAATYASMNDKAKALANLQAVSLIDKGVSDAAKSDPHFIPLRDSKEFRQLVGIDVTKGIEKAEKQ